MDSLQSNEAILAIQSPPGTDSISYIIKFIENIQKNNLNKNNHPNSEHNNESVDVILLLFPTLLQLEAMANKLRIANYKDFLICKNQLITSQHKSNSGDDTAAIQLLFEEKANKSAIVLQIQDSVQRLIATRKLIEGTLEEYVTRRENRYTSCKTLGSSMRSGKELWARCFKLYLPRQKRYINRMES